MTPLGQPVADRSDGQLRTSAVALVGDRPDVYEVILHPQSMRKDDFGDGVERSLRSTWSPRHG